MRSHFAKLRLCLICRESGINLNLDKCVCLVYSGKILGFIVSNEGKLPDPKKIQEIVNMPDPKTPLQIQAYTSILCCQSLLSFSNSQEAVQSATEFSFSQSRYVNAR